MDLIKCPICGEMYSPSYRRCPFCEEEERPARVSYRSRSRGARAADNKKRKSRSARGGLIAALIVVLGIMTWYIFSDKIMPHIIPASPDPTPGQDIVSDPVIEDPFYDPAVTEPVTDPAATDDPTPAPDPEADLTNAKLNRTDFTLNAAGETFQMQVSGVDVQPRWSVDDENVATIDADGTVHAVGGGNTTIHANYREKALDCIVRVKGPAYVPPVTVTPEQPTVSTEPAIPTEPATPTEPAEPTPATTVDVSNARLSTTDFTAKVGERVQLRVTGTEAKPAWSIADSSIATIDENGLIKGVARGKTTAYAKVGDRTLECIVRIQN